MAATVVVKEVAEAETVVREALVRHWGATLAALCPPAAAAASAAAAFTLRRLDGYDHINFSIINNNGGTPVAVVKLMVGGAGEVEATAAYWALQAAAARAAGAAVTPLPLPPSAGAEALVRVPLPGSDSVGLVAVYPWVEGGSLYDATHTAAATSSTTVEAAVAAAAATLGWADAALLAAGLPPPPPTLAVPTHVAVWDVASAGAAAAGLHCLADRPAVAAAAAAALTTFTVSVAPVVAAAAPDDVRRCWIHGDANDHNVRLPPTGGARLIDWDDAVHSLLLFDPAIALAYVLMGAPAGEAGLLDTAAAFLRAYCEACPLTPTEVGLLLPAVAARLAVSLVQSARAAAAAHPDRRPYILVHAAPAADLLDRLVAAGAATATGAITLSPAARARLAIAAGHFPAPPNPGYAVSPALSPPQLGMSRRVVEALAWLGRAGCVRPIVAVPPPGTKPPPAAACDAAGGWLPAAPTPAWAAVAAAAAAWPPGTAPWVYDFTGGGGHVADVVGTDPAALAAFTALMFGPLTSGEAGAPVDRIGWGRYGETRVLYTSDAYTGGGEGGPPPRTVHLGVDIEATAGTPVTSPLPGTIHSIARNAASLDYGPTIILRHAYRLAWVAGSVATSSEPTPPPAGSVDVVFYTLYGHLGLESLLARDGSARWRVGDAVAAGDTLGWVGGSHVNGGWPPHLHFQIDTEVAHGGWAGDYPGVCSVPDWPAYTILCPDPNLLLRCPYVAPHGWHPATTGTALATVTPLP